MRVRVPDTLSFLAPHSRTEERRAPPPKEYIMDLDGVLDEGEADMMRELENSSLEDVQMRQRLLENEIRVLRDESNRLALDLQGDKEKVKENFEKIKMNKQLPYLVGNVVEILDLKPEVRPVPHSHRPDRDREPGFPFISPMTQI